MITVTIDGVSKVSSSLAKFAADADRKKKKGLYRQGQKTLTKAVTYTPLETGALRASGKLEFEGDVLVISFGGPAAPYAIYVHEILSNVHPYGQAKFLERAVQEDAPLFAKLIGEEIMK